MQLKFTKYGKIVLHLELEKVFTPWSRPIFEKLIVPQLVEKFPAFYGT
jgi:hypothetical protein